MLQGYKTYICTALACLDVFGMWLGYVPQGTGLLVMSFLGFGSIAALRSGIRSEVAQLLGQKQDAPAAPQQ